MGIEEEEVVADPDDEYDKWRERETEEMDDDVRLLVKKWCFDRPGYYHGCKDKFIDHAISILKELKNEG